MHALSKLIHDVFSTLAQPNLLNKITVAYSQHKPLQRRSARRFGSALLLATRQLHAALTNLHKHTTQAGHAACETHV
jgi:hypothetical protein